jgi:hypothetical protein
MITWYRHVEEAAKHHPWRFAALSALLLSAFAGSFSAASHHPVREVATQLLLWGPGWFVLSGFAGRLRQARR